MVEPGDAWVTRPGDAAGGVARWAAVAALAVGLTAACARQSAPPGGPEDQRPPVVVRTVPAPFDTVTELDAAIRFEFDERISERVGSGALREAVTISPRVGVLDVSHGRHGLTVRVLGGLRPGLVYRVTLQPVVSDMFGNQLADPFELVFTTGGDASPTTLAGQVWDRITGRGVGEVTVHAVGADSLVHVSTTDADGIYAFRYLPAGDFTVQAFQDRNRNDSIDAGEVSGAVPAGLASGDTLLADIAVLAQDTTPAVVRGAQALDSVTVVVGFDDFVDPEWPAGDMTTGLALEGGSAPAIERVLHEAAYVELVDAVADSFARLDSLDRAEAAARDAAARDTLAAIDTLAAGDSLAVSDTLPAGDTLAVSGDTLPAVAPSDTVRGDSAVAGPGPTAPPGRRPPPALTPLSGSRPGLMEDTGRILPSSRVVLILAEPLQPGAEYTVQVDGVTNLVGLTGGGGEASFVWEGTEPDTLAADTLPTDTLPTDTMATDTLPTDTLSTDTLPTDTLATDTPAAEVLGRLPPDTVTVPVDARPARYRDDTAIRREDRDD